MATKYEVLASLIKRENEQYEYLNQGSDGNAFVLINILRILHSYTVNPPTSSRFVDDWETLANDIHDLIADAFTIEAFGVAQQDEPEPTKQDIADKIDDITDEVRRIGTIDDPAELDLPDTE